MPHTTLEEHNRKLLKDAFSKLESHLGTDVFVFNGGIGSGIDSLTKQLIEELSGSRKMKVLSVILTTSGGSLNPLKRMVTVFRHHYEKVIFIVPDYAYSAGTILCMAGDEIWMNYYSALGPIDPQVQTNDGSFVAALGYLDKVNELIEKSREGTLTDAEFMLLHDQDLGKLRQFEQAKELAIDFIEEWLTVYKFKDWDVHSDGTIVLEEDKKARAREIAERLSDNKTWKSHSRPITMGELIKMKLKVKNYEEDANLKELLDDYIALTDEYIDMNQMPLFFQTREVLS